MEIFFRLRDFSFNLPFKGGSLKGSGVLKNKEGFVHINVNLAFHLCMKYSKIRSTFDFYELLNIIL